MTAIVLPRSTDDFTAWYDAKSEDEQLLIDEINDRIFEGFGESEYEEFISELNDLGIETAEQFLDAFFYQTENYAPEAEFAQYLEEEVNCTDIPSHLEGCIDWQVLWDSYYRFDFSSFEMNNTTYFFHNSF